MSHSYSSNLIHLVFSTKNRADLIGKSQQEQLYAYLFGIGKNLEIEFLAIGGVANHIHILFALPGKRKLSDAVRDLKANSSRWMKERVHDFAWQSGFGAFSVSASQIPVVKAYIRDQEMHHRKRSFEDEFVTLLRKSGIAFDPKWVFG
jgi:REP element-mobilizing transposase RayT